MTTKTSREVIVTRTTGEVVTMHDSDKVETKTTVTAVCDGPRCAAHNGNMLPKSVEWVDENVAKDPSAIPDDLARFIKVQFTPFKDEVFEFCGPRCLKDHLEYAYIPPKSPRELAAEVAERSGITKAVNEAVNQADGQGEEL